MEKSDIMWSSLIAIGILFAVIIIPHIQNLWMYYVLNVEGLWNLSDKYPFPLSLELELSALNDMGFSLYFMILSIIYSTIIGFVLAYIFMIYQEKYSESSRKFEQRLDKKVLEINKKLDKILEETKHK